MNPLVISLTASVLLAPPSADPATTIIDPVKVTRAFTPSSGWQQCDHWLAARAQMSGEAQRLEDWALGYATSYAFQLTNEQNIKLKMTNGELFDAIDALCHKQPIGIGAAIRQTLDHKRVE